ncbi:MAG: pyruvate kinase [Corynebacterium sp.]|uniref:pyruvate kinase n=1 Tax=Corynebacterium sp. TaxID=1720 RepID=UPI0026DCC1B3|nr:pyruvate kinase [Corynebacterium sp.]MDO5029982.1 pyruvate kinase [Corynebacterium sp.]
MPAQSPEVEATDTTEDGLPRLDLLISQITDLIAELDSVSADAASLLAEVPEERRRHAENLLHYAHLRTIDIRELQNQLHDLGVTSLTTIETFTRGRLELALNALLALAGRKSDIDIASIIADDERADLALDDNATALFGQEREEVTSHIMVTLPTEAADDAALVESFAVAGMDLARINCAHDGPEQWNRMIDNVNAAAKKVGRRIPVSMDLAGPKLRTGTIEPGPRVGRARVVRDDAGQVVFKSKIWLTPRLAENPLPVPDGLPGRPALPLQADSGWLEQLQVDDVITLHDSRSAKRHFTVVRIERDAEGETLGVLAEGDKNAWIAEGTHLRSNYEVTRAGGVPATIQKLRFNTGDQLVLTSREEVTILPRSAEDIPRVFCSLPTAVSALTPGDPVLFDDGALAAEVVEVSEKSDDQGTYVDALLRVTRAKPKGQSLAENKGINLPKTDLPLNSLTEDDIEDLRFVVENADIAAVSFIRTKQDVEYVFKILDEIAAEHENVGREDLARRARELGVVLKIETIPAFENLPNIIITSLLRAKTGLMIARGDLAVELGFDRMGEVPGQILTLAQAAGVPTILGTQVLENMAKAGLPSRAEITDAAFALRAECVMLNKGPHITEAIQILNDLARKMGRSQRKSRVMLRKIRSWSD